MSAAAQGAKIQRKEDEVTNELKQGVTTHAAQAAAQATAGAPAGSFPRDFSAGTEEWDKITKLKQSMTTEPGRTPFGDLQFSDRDAYALLRKEDAAKAAAFDAWFGEKYNNSDLPTRQLAQELNPEYYAAREAKMAAKAKMALRIALIKLRGPKSEEDLQILFGLQTGDIRLEEGWDRIGYEAGQVSTGPQLAADIGLTTRLFVPLGARARQVDARNIADTRVLPFANQPFASANGPFVSSMDQARIFDEANPVNAMLQYM